MLERLSPELDPKQFSSLVEVIRHVGKTHADLPAFSCLGKTISYAELDRLSDRFADYLRNESGLLPGDRIGIQLPNLLQFPVALYGALKAGLIAVTTNPLYTGREMRHQFRDSGVKAVVILENFCDKLQEVIGEHHRFVDVAEKVAHPAFDERRHDIAIDIGNGANQDRVQPVIEKKHRAVEVLEGVVDFLRPLANGLLFLK